MNIQKLKQNEHQVLSCSQKKCKIITPDYCKRKQVLVSRPAGGAEAAVVDVVAVAGHAVDGVGVQPAA